MSIAGVRVKVEVELPGQGAEVSNVERAYREALSERAAEADRTRWLADWTY
jgi:hypothetical protein